jgi:hypothetical protein
VELELQKGKYVGALLHSRNGQVQTYLWLLPSEKARPGWRKSSTEGDGSGNNLWSIATNTSSLKRAGIQSCWGSTPSVPIAVNLEALDEIMITERSK